MPVILPEEKLHRFATADGHCYLDCLERCVPDGGGDPFDVCPNKRWVLLHCNIFCGFHLLGRDTGRVFNDEAAAVAAAAKPPEQAPMSDSKFFLNLKHANYLPRKYAK